MHQNKIQSQKHSDLFKLSNNFKTESQCTKALFNWRWPSGFRCPDCSSEKFIFLNKSKLYQCSSCHHQASLISRTIFEQTKLPLMTWFKAIHLLTQSEICMSAVELKRLIGASYNTAWSMKHKIMQVTQEEVR